MEQLPTRELRPFVECIWYSPATIDTDFEIVPDGCVDACFVLSQSRPHALLFGTTTRTTSYQLEAGAPYFGVRFRPGKASLFVREKVSELTDAQVSLDDFLGLTAEEVLDAANFNERKHCMESLLLSALSRMKHSTSDSVSHAISRINSNHGDVRVRDLALSCNLSERQLERLFFERVGLTPKRYARIQRFRSVLSHLEDPSDSQRPKLADVAALYGYADQSHLVREFKDFAHRMPATG